jgi:hypothetical protein
MCMKEVHDCTGTVRYTVYSIHSTGTVHSVQYPQYRYCTQFTVQYPQYRYMISAVIRQIAVNCVPDTNNSDD